MGARAAIDTIPVRWRQRLSRIDAAGRSRHVEWWRHEAGGDEIDDVEREAYRVLFESGEETALMAVADLGDGDNNHELCPSLIRCGATRLFSCRFADRSA